MSRRVALYAQCTHARRLVYALYGPIRTVHMRAPPRAPYMSRPLSFSHLPLMRMCEPCALLVAGNRKRHAFLGLVGGKVVLEEINHPLHGLPRLPQERVVVAYGAQAQLDVVAGKTARGVPESVKLKFSVKVSGLSV
jgi:hypothetical protein